MIVGYAVQFLAGLVTTIEVALTALCVGLSVGLLGASAKLSSYRWLTITVNAATNMVRGLPELLVLFFIYYGSTIFLSYLFGSYVKISSFTASVTSLGLIFGAYASETLRGAYTAIPAGQWEAAKAVGFTYMQTFFRIILPQLWIHALPGLSNLWFILLKDTALVALIGLTDVMRVAQNVSAATQQPFTVYVAAALIYLLLTSLSLIGQRYFEKHFSRHIQGEP